MARRIQEHTRLVTGLYLLEQVGVVRQGFVHEWDPAKVETEGTSFKLKQVPVMCLDGVDFTRTYSNNCVEVFNVLGIEAAWAAIMKELRHLRVDD